MTAALVLTDSFEDAAMSALKWNVGGWSYSSAFGRNGQGGANDSGATLGRDIPTADQDATVVVGFALRQVGSNNSGTSAVFGLFSDAGATQHVRTSFGTNGWGWSLSYGPTAAGVIYTFLPNVWYFVEIQCTLGDGTAGSIYVWVNGTLVYSATGVDTKNGGTKTVFDHFRVNTSVISPNRRQIQLDDFYMLSGSGSVPFGDLAIELVKPNGNGDTSDFVGSDGNQVDNYLLVDEASADLTDWAGGDTVGQRDLYAAENLSRTNGVIRGVMVHAYAQNGDAGPRGIGTILKSGATVSTATDTALSSTPSRVAKGFLINPATGVAFTLAEVNAMQIGAEVTS